MGRPLKSSLSSLERVTKKWWNSQETDNEKVTTKKNFDVLESDVLVKYRADMNTRM